MKDHRVAIQGEQCSFHHLAATAYFGTNARFIHCRTFGEVCNLLLLNHAEHGVMAIENALSGSILSNYELIRSLGLHITGELFVKVSLHLMKHPESKTEELKRVISHPVALAQCQSFLLQHPELEPVEDADTARCALKVRNAGPSAMACIANEEAAVRYSLEIIHRNVQKERKDHTRFLVLSGDAVACPQANKASVSFNLEHEVGSLEKVLTIFRRFHVNLCKIQSVPRHGDPGRYTFHIDLLWDNFVDYCAAMKKVQKITGDLCILGVYKAAPLPGEKNECKTLTITQDES